MRVYKFAQKPLLISEYFKYFCASFVGTETRNMARGTEKTSFHIFCDLIAMTERSEMITLSLHVHVFFILCGSKADTIHAHFESPHQSLAGCSQAKFQLTSVRGKFHVLSPDLYAWHLVVWGASYRQKSVL